MARHTARPLIAEALGRNESSGQVAPGALQVGTAGHGGPLGPAWLGLGDLPAGGLLDAVAGATARVGIAGAGGAALAVRDSVLEIRLAGVPGAGREGTLPIADLDQVAQPVIWLVP